jgi:hypothetical protein
MTLFASGSTVAIAFYLPLNQLDEEDQPMQEIANKVAEASGTPFISFLPVIEIKKLAEEIGLKNIHTISTKDMMENILKAEPTNMSLQVERIFLSCKNK